MSDHHTYDGVCHCGAITVRLRTRFDVDALPLRRCDCSFCRRHGARTLADPGGFLTITETAAGALRRYRFGLRTADFLLCASCGVYAGAVIPEAEGLRATLNVNLLDVRDRLDPAPPLASYDGETPDERRARRLARWTPTHLAPAPG